jgi:hypothetical protein
VIHATYAKIKKCHVILFLYKICSLIFWLLFVLLWIPFLFDFFSFNLILKCLIFMSNLILIPLIAIYLFLYHSLNYYFFNSNHQHLVSFHFYIKFDHYAFNFYLLFLNFFHWFFSLNFIPQNFIDWEFCFMIFFSFYRVILILWPRSQIWKVSSSWLISFFTSFLAIDFFFNFII